jgi:hypothetical protein
MREVPSHLHAGKLLIGPLQRPRCLLPGVCHPLLSCLLRPGNLLLRPLRQRCSVLLRPLCRLWLHLKLCLQGCHLILQSRHPLLLLLLLLSCLTGCRHYRQALANWLSLHGDAGIQYGRLVPPLLLLLLVSWALAGRCILWLPHAGLLPRLLQCGADDACQLWAVPEQRMQLLYWTAAVAALQVLLLLPRLLLLLH